MTSAAPGPQTSLRAVGLLIVSLAVWSLVLWARPAVAQVDRSEQAAALSQAAMTRAQQGKFGLCHELYLQAWRTDPKTWSYKYSAARCAQKDGKLKIAEELYREVAKRGAADLQLAVRSRKRWDLLREQRVACEQAAQKAAQLRRDQHQAAVALAAKQAADRKRKEAAQIAAREHERQRKRRIVLWSGVAASAVAGAAGGYLVFDGFQRGDELQEALAVKGVTGKVAGISRADALSRQQAANVRVGAGAGLVGLGLAGAAATYWWLGRTGKSTAQLQLHPGGAALAWRLAW